MCFDLAWAEHIFIVIIVIVAIIALLRLLVAFVLPRLGLGGEIVSFLVSAVRIIIWAIVCIAAVIFIFDLIGCLIPYLSGGGSRLR